MKQLSILITAVIVINLAFCTTKEKVVKEASKISFEKDVLPILKDRCTPCHFPETGKKKMLDTYQANRDNIDEIIKRIQLSKEDPLYMPFKSKKTPLNDSLIQVFKNWKQQGLLP